MMKATSYEVDYNFVTRQDGTRIFMDMKCGFKTYAEAERWAHHNTIDGKVCSIYPIEEDDV